MLVSKSPEALGLSFGGKKYIPRANLHHHDLGDVIATNKVISCVVSRGKFEFRGLSFGATSWRMMRAKTHEVWKSKGSVQGVEGNVFGSWRCLGTGSLRSEGKKFPGGLMVRIWSFHWETPVPSLVEKPSHMLPKYKKKKKNPENLRGPRSEVNPETHCLKILVFLKNEESEEISNIITKIVTGNSLP